MRIAVAGAGAFGIKHLDGLAEIDGVTVTSIVSRRLEQAEEVARKYGAEQATTDLGEVLARDDVDAVDICTPNGLHRVMTVAACAAGKHVLVEKPMAVSLDDADAMIAAADAAGRVLMPAQNIRFAPACRAAGLALADGRIGDLVGVRAVLGHTGPQDWAPGADWFFDREQSGGGALLDLGVHLFDLVRAVTGDEIAVEGAVLKARASVPGIEDAAEVAFRLGRGAIGSLRASWDSTPPSGLQLTLVGTTGTITVQAGKTGRPVLRGGDGTSAELDLPEPVNPYALFAAAAAGRSPAPLDGRDGKAAVAAVLDAYACAGRSFAKQ